MSGCNSCNNKLLALQQTQAYAQKYTLQSTSSTTTPIITEKPITQLNNIGTIKLQELASILKTDPNNKIIHNQIKSVMQYHSK
jgi:hypothetical protein